MAVGLALQAGVVLAEDAPVAAPSAVADNLEVSMEYTLTVDGQVVDSADSAEPFRFVQGQHQVIPGLERALAGMQVGQSKTVTVSPEDGYGPADPSAVVEVAKTQLPTGVVPEVGMMLRGVNPDGNSFRARVDAVKEDTVTLDLNHPLAGKTLQFQVTILSVAPPAAAQ